jgi:putrescine transport system ATP-binding protein
MPGRINTFGATLREVNYLGGVSMIRLALDAGADLRVAVANASRAMAEDFEAGQRVTASFAPGDCVVLDS